MTGSLGNKVVGGTLWTLFEKFSVQIVHFVVTVILSRLLTPDDYGVVALLTIFVALAGVIAESGFGNALVQKKDTTELEFNSVFYFSILLSSLAVAVLYFVAPRIASFYKMPELTAIMRVTSITLVFNAVSSVQNAELARKMLFNLSFRVSLVSAVCSAAVGITMACLDFGPWALVWSTVTSGLVTMLALWHFIAWRPKLMFSLSALKPLFRFGWKLTLSSLLDTGFNNLYGLVIGRLYAKADLAYVNRGRMLPELLMGNVNSTLCRVAFPALSRMQDEKERMRRAMRRMITASTFLVFPLMTMMAIVARKIVLILLGTPWEPAVPYVQVFCFTFALWPFHTINLQCIQAIGRSDVFLVLEVIKKTLGVIVLFIFIPIGILPYMLASAFIIGPISVIVNTWPSRSLLGYAISMQLKDVLPSAGLCVLTGLAMIGIDCLFCSPTFVMTILCLVLQLIVGCVVYFGLGVLFRLRPLFDLRDALVQKFPSLSKMPFGTKVSL